MKQIDLEPTGYRKKHRDTGRWVQNINKPLCRWMAIGVALFVCISAFKFASEGGNPVILLFGAGMGICVGGLWVLSLKSTDW